MPPAVVKALAEWRLVPTGFWRSPPPYCTDENKQRDTPRVQLELLDSERPGPALEDFDDGKTYVDFRSCEALFARIAAKAETKELGTEPWKVNMTVLALQHGDDVLMRRSCWDEATGYGRSERVYLDSLVGPILSYRRVVQSTPCGSDAFGTPDFYTIDLRDGERLDITDVVDESSLVEALENHNWIQERTSADQRKAFETFEDIQSKHPRLRHFAFYDWSPDPKRVTVRFWIPQVAGKWNGFEHLEVQVEPTSEMTQYFEAADQGEGFYMSDEGPVF
jgi:hypothetical protein